MLLYISHNIIHNSNLSLPLANVGSTNINNVPGLNELGVLNIYIYLNLLAALLPLVELDAGGQVLLVGAAEGPVDNGCSCSELTMFHRD